jgi:hypothetical protein
VRARSVRGQAAAEYLGVLLIVSVIIAALLITDIGHDITGQLSELARDVAGDE